jgi:hypothetical protein
VSRPGNFGQLPLKGDRRPGKLGQGQSIAGQGGTIMALKFLGKDPGSNVDNSPTIWDDGDAYVIQGWRITDPADLAEIGEVPAHETVVRIPKRMMAFFPEVTGGGPRSDA